ncbi:glycosyltransferase family 2 protein [Aquibium carbonis]|nr:glycosyltransferase family 2 protein [Aquibium carbonis]
MTDGMLPIEIQKQPAVERDLAVTVVIPVKNEERNLPRCLSALLRFQEIIVVDSGSTDRTQEIAASAGARVIDFQWNGRFPKKRNWILIHHRPNCEWVLFIDADEVLDDAFCNELARILGSTAHSGFWLNYTNYFLGRKLRHGLPQKKLALLKVGRGLYERVDEDSWSSLDMEVHEHPVVEGTVGEIKVPIEHNDFRGLEKFIERHVDYARWEARRYANLGERSPHESSPLTARQRFKYRNITKAWYPLFYFIYTYIYKAGFLDGGPGFSYAFYKMWYFHTIRLLIIEAAKERR